MRDVEPPGVSVVIPAWDHSDSLRRCLDALAAQVLSGQKDQMSILAHIDQINGMLVDLVS